MRAQRAFKCSAVVFVAIVLLAVVPKGMRRGERGEIRLQVLAETNMEERAFRMFTVSNGTDYEQNFGAWSERRTITNTWKRQTHETVYFALKEHGSISLSVKCPDSGQGRIVLLCSPAASASDFEAFLRGLKMYLGVYPSLSYKVYGEFE